MPYGFKTFGDGLLPTTKGTLVTIATNHSAAVTVTLVNLSSSAVKNVNVYVNANGTSRRIFPKNLEIGVGDDGGMATSCVVEMEEGDTIEGSAGAASSIEYRIAGLDRE